MDLVNFVHDWVSLFDSPMHIYCDRGAQFTSALLRDLAQFRGAQLHHSTAYHSQAQGMVERVNKTLKTALKCSEAPTECHNNLPWAFLALRNLLKEDLKHFSSNDLVFGDKLCLPGEFFVSHEEDESMSLHAFIISLTRRVASFRYNPPRKVNRTSYLNSTLFNPQVIHIFARNEVRRHLLQPAYKGRYLIVDRNPKYFTLDFTTHQDHISINR